MNISRENLDGVICVKMSGRLDAISAPEAERVLEEIQNSGSQQVLLDLEGLEYISSVGLRVILTLFKELRQKNGKVALCCLSDYVMEIFEVSGFSSVIPIADSVEAGLATFSTS
jgi:anti-anti-sigma factor